MIKLLNESNINDLTALLSNINTIMGQPLGEEIQWTGRTRREMLIDKLVSGWIQWGNKSRNVIGWYEGDRLRSVLFQDFSITIKAWAMSYYFSDYNNYHAIHTGTKCGKLAMDIAEKAEYYEYYRVIEAGKVKAFDRAWKDSIRSRYIMVIDEIVPAHEKPITTQSWDWLFESAAKTVDVAIVKGILLPEYRPYK
jgi:hypothetical protein